MDIESFEREYEEQKVEHLLKCAGLIAAELEWEADHARAAAEPAPDEEIKNRIWREIERKLEKERREEARGKAVRRGIKGAMLAAVALSILLVGLFVTVSAFRVPVSNYFFEKYDKYSKFIVDAGGYTI